MLVLHAFRNPQLLVLLSHLALYTIASPLPPVLTLRAEYCLNAPSTVVGTFLPPRTLHSLPARYDVSTIIWCTPGSSTYVRLRMLSPIPIPPQPNPIVSGIMTLAYHMVVSQAQQQDGVIPVGQAADGVYRWVMHGGLTLRTWNANNHQMTYGVLGAALLALVQYMERWGYGPVGFSVFDGANQVGAGRLD